MIPVVLLALVATVSSASVEAVEFSPERCAEILYEELQGKPAEAFAAIKPLRDVAKGGDERLPGQFIIDPPSERRQGNARDAIRIAADLAKGQGRPSWVSSANSRWIIDRLVTDLSDFMGQDLSPYLCGGVESYVVTLRGYLDQVSTGSGRSLEEIKEAQIERTRGTIEAAHTVMRPVPTPRYAPDLRPIAVIEVPSERYHGFALRRGRDDIRLVLPAAQNARSTVYGPRIDPDLPLKQKVERALDSDEARFKAIDDLLAAAVAGGFVNEVSAIKRASNATEPFMPPVLAKLAEANQILTDDEVRISDALTRGRLAAALSDIEILDYVARAADEEADPLVAQIEATFDAILEARRAALIEAGG
ncbi:hypothetical protein FP2506_02869 [Fulvimarina pelagi HTCC2506]|uniref:Uncharacterized protein n=2 Tax=Fulvimarina pelagi TaxID=217511 RepID=Q0G0F9_9HYPH|nr:hypothetical protein FP2506_02869 [Fulvimarina pelagi HTCC2506]